MQRHPVAGSERKPLAGAKRTGPAQPDERLEVSVVLRQSATAALQDRIERLNKGDTSLAPMTREAFAASHGAAKADIAAVERFAAQHHLTVVSSSAPRRTVVLAGTVANFQDAFGVTLGNYEHAEGSYRGREGVITLPRFAARRHAGGGAGILHADHDCLDLQVSRGHRRRPDHRHHRAGRRHPRRRFENLF